MMSLGNVFFGGKDIPYAYLKAEFRAVIANISSSVYRTAVKYFMSSNVMFPHILNVGIKYMLSTLLFVIQHYYYYYFGGHEPA